ncbi:MAG: DUF2945 domain-containing protein [Janthinobacterium lividum]
MSKIFEKGTKVVWNWGQGRGIGKVVDHFKDSVHKVLQGSEITRHGTDDNPAYLIEQDNGHQVLKLHSELTQES